jgi:hypothetical protein
VTEGKWAENASPLELLGYLSRTRRAGPSPRKFRLVGCACLRHIPRLLGDQRLVEAIDVTERYADGVADPKELRAAQHAASLACHEIGQRSQGVEPQVSRSEVSAAAAVHSLAAVPRRADGERRLSRRSAKGALFHAVEAVKYREEIATSAVTAGSREREYQCLLVRDIFGNPFRPVSFDPRWRTSDTVALARGIYEDRAVDRFPLLADALMDAGCNDEQVVGHCRSEGPHVRGFWVVDLVLGKE